MSSLTSTTAGEKPDRPATPGRTPAGDRSLLPYPFLVLMVAALVMITPFFLYSNPSGHDFEFHMNSWMEVLRQWKLGVWLPGWAGLAHFGYGEARFIFYPPLSWTAGAALGALLPWRAVPGAYVWLSLTLSGCSMFFLARRYLARQDAILVAVCYIASPYYVVIVYWRSAMAELLAGALLPLLLLAVLDLKHKGREGIVPLALIVAAAWLTNIPSAVMLTYSLGLLLGLAAIFGRKPSILIHGALALLLGIGLASFYLLPVAEEQKWINLSQVLSPGIRPQDNFLFTVTEDADHNRFNWLVSAAASGEIMVLAASALLAARRARALGPSSSDRAPWIFIVWGAFSSLLTLRYTQLAWDRFPEIQFVQFPWRWLLCINVALALLVNMAWRRWLPRILLLSALLVLLAWVASSFQPPWWDTASDIAEMVDNQVTGQGYEGTDEYVPRHADASEVKLDAPLVAWPDGAAARVQISRWTPQSKAFSLSAASAGEIVLRLFQYPAWKVEVNGALVTSEARDDTGQMMIPVQEGQNQVRLTFVTTVDRVWGRALSALSLVLLFALVGFERRGKLRPGCAR